MRVRVRAQSVGFVAALAVAAGCSTARVETRAAGATLDGTWRSEPVQLVRGSVDETYEFEVQMPHETPGSAGVMLISYGPTDEPARRRVIQQAMRVESGASTGELLLVGSDPRLMSGEPFVGLYEADTLACSPPAASTPHRLECGWGSDGHGRPVSVTLSRSPGGG